MLLLLLHHARATAHHTYTMHGHWGVHAQARHAAALTRHPAPLRAAPRGGKVAHFAGLELAPTAAGRLTLSGWGRGGRQAARRRAGDARALAAYALPSRPPSARSTRLPRKASAPARAPQTEGTAGGPRARTEIRQTPSPPTRHPHLAPWPPCCQQRLSAAAPALGVESAALGVPACGRHSFLTASAHWPPAGWHLVCTLTGDERCVRLDQRSCCCCGWRWPQALLPMPGVHCVGRSLWPGSSRIRTCQGRACTRRPHRARLPSPPLKRAGAPRQSRAQAPHRTGEAQAPPSLPTPRSLAAVAQAPPASATAAQAQATATASAPAADSASVSITPRGQERGLVDLSPPHLPLPRPPPPPPPPPPHPPMQHALQRRP